MTTEHDDFKRQLWFLLHAKEQRMRGYWSPDYLDIADCLIESFRELQRQRDRVRYGVLCGANLAIAWLEGRPVLFVNYGDEQPLLALPLYRKHLDNLIFDWWKLTGLFEVLVITTGTHHHFRISERRADGTRGAERVREAA